MALPKPAGQMAVVASKRATNALHPQFKGPSNQEGTECSKSMVMSEFVIVGTLLDMKYVLVNILQNRLANPGEHVNFFYSSGIQEQNNGPKPPFPVPKPNQWPIG